MSPKRRTGGNPRRGYLVLGTVIVTTICFFVFWPTDSPQQWQVRGAAPGAAGAAAATDGSLTKDRVIEALLAENDRLQTAVASGRDLKGGACDCSAETSRLQSKINRLEEDLAAERARASRAVVASARDTGGNTGRVVDNSGGEHLAVASCAKQKLEFLRWRQDDKGNKLWCPFTPENYDNWEKLPPMCDYISIECLGVGNLRAAHIYGFGGPTLMIGYADVMMWEFVWARHTTQKNMAELGTMSGGTSLYWGMAARVRGGRFDTFDLNDNRHSMPKRGWLENMHFHKVDILSNVQCDDPSTHVRDVVDVLNTGTPMIALFDNGNKVKETDCYCRYLAVGSVLLLHDWEHLDLPKPHWEMTYSYVKDELEKRGFKRAYFDFAEHLGSSTRVFIRVSEGPL